MMGIALKTQDWSSEIGYANESMLTEQGLVVAGKQELLCQRKV